MNSWLFMMGLISGVLVGIGIIAVYNLAHEDDDFEYNEYESKEDE